MNLNESFYLGKEEPNKSCLLFLRDLILKQDSFVNETTKYGMPCFCYQKKMFCYLWTDKKTDEPYILFVEGQYLAHPKLESGSRKRMKMFRVNPAQDIPIQQIKTLLQQAIDLYKSGTISVNR